MVFDIFIIKNLKSVAYMYSVILSEQIVGLSLALKILRGMFLTVLHI